MISTNLFNEVSLSQKQLILNQIGVKESTFKKGDILAMQGEVCNRLIVLLEGVVVAEMSDPSGKVVKVEDIYAPSPLAILFLFGNNNAFPVQVTAKEPTKALVIPKQMVVKMLSLDEQLLKNFLDISANYASRITHKLHFMSFRTIRQKLAMYILNLSTKPNEKQEVVEMDKTQTELAEYFGVSRPSLSRELKYMHDDDLIKIDKKQITIYDREKLIRLVNF